MNNLIYFLDVVFPEDRPSTDVSSIIIYVGIVLVVVGIIFTIITKLKNKNNN